MIAYHVLLSKNVTLFWLNHKKTTKSIPKNLGNGSVNSKCDCPPPTAGHLSGISYFTAINIIKEIKGDVKNQP